MRYLYLTLFLASFMVCHSSCHKQESAEPIITPDTVNAASETQISATQVNGHVRVDNDIQAYEGPLAGVLNAGIGEVLNYSNNYFTFYVTYTPHDSIKFTSSGAIFGMGVANADFINVKFKIIMVAPKPGILMMVMLTVRIILLPLQAAHYRYRGAT